MQFAQKKTDIPTEADALPGRDTPLEVPNEHYVNSHPIKPPFPKGLEQAMFAMGCFWGSERLFWQMEGVYTTASGYAGGYTPNPIYEEVCTGRTGHAETVLVVYDPTVISYAQLLKAFWEAHDPTQGMRQGDDIGVQYRSVIFTLNDAQRQAAEASRDEYEKALKVAGQGAVTTEICPAPVFYYAEGYHQQYLAKNPAGYCGLKGTGVSCAI
ncbi:MAG TPA: peptide-methionine (S)-S-oxide reductase MsrA [Gammaproteobacteria bacterium]|nr:peptide-methionine (S)-S-oxide reductase MsrA [Gammaproteobacteria bacterium]